ncbi:hypothetical protein HPB52_000120 [Rhipicephalus sanguineus]|uniref:Uncharacterized protein n=1 Tax=Rhipicephalus sanguineus TaxID=34632 RepID=A0A9D4Q6H4_RHISA|nr:hypothetical protein HPB52_000120 [Rhipicephalus sanguineus]
MAAIMDSVRDGVDGSWNRLHLLTRQDLYNIQRDFNINCDERLHSDDYTSVLLWVEKMKLLDGNPVLFFKQQGTTDNATVLQRQDTELLDDDDFMLAMMTNPQKELLEKLGSDRLCVDGTHGTTGKCEDVGAKVLRTMMDASTQEELAEVMKEFDEFCSEHGRENNGLMKFNTYFKNNYANRATLWAACH